MATVHGDDITIGGERSSVEFLIKMISRKYEIKKQVIGEDPELEKSGRIWNRVIEWNDDGITIEADQRHVREILKNLELVRANHSATPCAVERKDESKEENRCGRGQTQTEHEWHDVNDVDYKDKPQMTDDDDNDSQALTGGDITRYRALVARISYLSQDRPEISSSRQCRYVVRWRSRQCGTWNVSRGSGGTSPGSRERSAVSAGSRVVSWKRTQTLTGEATRPPDDRCQLGVIMRGGH